MWLNYATAAVVSQGRQPRAIDFLLAALFSRGGGIGAYVCTCGVSGLRFCGGDGVRFARGIGCDDLV